MKWSFPALACFALACSSAKPPVGGTFVSTSLALTADDHTLWVVNQDSDSVSVIDTASRARLAEIALGPTPAVDPASQRFEPAVSPRAVAIVPGEKKIYVAGQTANKVFVVDAAARSVTKTIDVGSEPTAIVTAADGHAVYVVNHQSATVSKIDPGRDAVVATLPVGEAPWGAALSADGKLLYVTEFLLDAGVIVVDTGSFQVVRTLKLAEQAPGSDKRVPNGEPRGAYTAVPRPGAGGGGLWIAHLLLAVQTAQPALDFESTVFPTISIAAADGSAESRRLLFKPAQVPGVSGAFFDSVSGPRALAFTPDGRFALLALGQSEDVMVFDGNSGNEVGLVRPIPGSMLEGIVVDHAGKHAYVDGRNTHNVIALDIDAANSVTPVAVSGAPIERLAGADPMPSELRLGQRLFYSANSSAYPLTQNFWVACSSCHLEGGTDAVTWLFTQGPRDTPSNAGGPINTGFLFRQAVRTSLLEYDDTIDIEQGGAFHKDSPTQQPLLTALGNYVNYAIPLPQNPFRQPGGLTSEQSHGQSLFADHCQSCHSGAWLTDSGAGNPTLDRTGTILLHDIGTCVKNGAHPDMPSTDKVTMQVRDACQFDTPTLRGIFATPPYFHDGSARTLEDAVGRLDFISSLSAQDKADLVAYLKTL